MTEPTVRAKFWTEYSPLSGKCACSCGARYRAKTDAEADRWLDAHTRDHEVADRSLRGAS